MSRSKAQFSRTNQPVKIKRFLTYHDLPAKGINYHPNHLRVLWSKGRFPKPFKLSPHRLAWPEEVIDAWLDSRVEVA
jgi:hypothetical protein